MLPTVPIITYCINGDKCYRIPLAQIPLAQISQQIPLAQISQQIPLAQISQQIPLQPLVRTPLGNSNKQNKVHIINNGINKNNKNVSPKIITKKMVLESCANDCKWP
jgi:hypothetical protein